MKRLLIRIILALSLFGGVKAVNAQAHLVIESLINYPDTAYHGLNVPLSAVIKNIGNTPFQGTLQLVFTTNGNPNFSYLYFNSGAVANILPQDTAVLNDPQGYTFDSTFYRLLGNVVVVWPYTTQLVDIDTFYTNVYFIANPFLGIRKYEGISDISVYPNPAGNWLQLDMIENNLESVRIIDLSGRAIRQYPPGQGPHTRIPLDGLPAGIYLLQVENSEKKQFVVRFVKLNE
jgi:hypothetical protein